jgi:hypothetical protein
MLFNVRPFKFTGNVFLWKVLLSDNYKLSFLDGSVADQCLQKSSAETRLLLLSRSFLVLAGGVEER